MWADYCNKSTHCIAISLMNCNDTPGMEAYTGDSFRDLTRIARINDRMWTELFLEDADYLSKELDILIHHLSEYSEALKARDAEQLRALLKDGREKKATAGGN